MATITVDYFDTPITVTLIRKPVKNLNLNVRPDMTVMVSANDSISEKRIREFILKKAEWILKQLRYFEAYQQPEKTEKEYVSGESFKYLGRQYRLKVYLAEQDLIRYYRGRIELFTTQPENRRKKKRMITNWYKERSQKKFTQSLDRIYPVMKKYGVDKPALKIRQMKTRWGSCQNKEHAIVLNSDLIKAPKFCIDYVVLHELIHFIRRNHDKEFLLFLTALMPDWQERKKILDEEVVRDL